VDLIDECVTSEMNVALVLQVFGLHGLFARSRFPPGLSRKS